MSIIRKIINISDVQQLFWKTAFILHASGYFFVEVSDEIAPSFLDGNLGDTATNALRGNGSARVGRE